MTPAAYPIRFESPSGLRVELNANGSIRRIDHRDVILNLFLGSEVEGGPANLYLRRHGAAIECAALLGPQSPGAVRVDEQGLSVCGEWNQVAFTLTLTLAGSAPLWLWRGTLENRGAASMLVDLVYAQDLALAPYGAVRMNEYYVSQYVDYTPLVHGRCGHVLAVRQNLAVGGRNPWAVIGSLRRAASFATDALQLHGLAARAGEVGVGLRSPTLEGRRRQHEHSMAVIQDAPLQLEPAKGADFGFFGWFEEHHAAASSAADLAFVDRALGAAEAEDRSPIRVEKQSEAATLFSARPVLKSLDLTDAEIGDLFGEGLRHVEREGGSMLSFFAGESRHVVLKGKELQVLRPHGHIIRSGGHLVPDEASLTSTTWMAGVFHSLVTQGHVNINRFLSTIRSYLGLQRCGGQRLFVELADGWRLLDVPSAYEMAPNGCRWIYKHESGVIEVRSWAPVDRHELDLSIEFVSGPPCRLLASHHVALNGDDGEDALPASFVHDGNGVVVRPAGDGDVARRFPEGYFRVDAGRGTTIERVAGDEELFLDRRSRRQPFVTLTIAPARSASLRITGHLVSTPAAAERAADWAADEAEASGFWRAMVGAPAIDAPTGAASDQSSRLRDILPWLAHNAMIHYLAPRGLEQYSGGGWGTRDVCQGPVEMLLALGRWEPMRDLLVRVFKTQNADGDWPQWFMFFERERGIRPADSHGDIVFWPLLALAHYLIASEEASILDEAVPFFHPDGDDRAEKTTIWGHVERALEVIAKRVIPGTSLAAYGHGDWNDSLQPVDPAMSAHLCSAWTVTLHHQTLATLAKALRRAGRVAPAESLEASARRVKEEFHRLLIADGTIPGYVDFRTDGRVERLLHPSDRATGIRYSLLPMIHAIIDDLLSPAEAAAHVALIKQHLLAADGARLFDRPFPYHGGPQRYFQRAESSTFFGREIGIMYTHAHLRFAEAMAHYGEAEAFLLALLQANPIALRSVVPSARLRQANCYYSSSDAAFLDRYQALAEYEKVKTGEVGVEGGWRVYSSGAGIALRLVNECLLGIRRRRSTLVLDPVIPKSLDGLRADVELAAQRVRIVYQVAEAGHGPTAVTLNGTSLAFDREANPYRTGGAELSMDAVRGALTDSVNLLEIRVR